MRSSVLNSPRAVAVNIEIMQTWPNACTSWKQKPTPSRRNKTSKP